MHDAACEGVQGNRYRPRARLWLPACALWRSSTGPCVHCRRYTGHFRSYAVGSAGPEAQARAVRLTPLGYPVSLRPPCIIRYPSRDTLCLHLPCPRRGTPSDRNKTGQSEPPVPPVLQPVMSSPHASLRLMPRSSSVAPQVILNLRPAALNWRTALRFRQSMGGFVEVCRGWMCPVGLFSGQSCRFLTQKFPLVRGS